ncbi:MAG: hypothetical protein ACRBB0_26910 [Pelagimonas sp.]|uniref:hypothetical protein n=1 Tax=Pelagimonas sp. TaxID=2073170 RepID=UPI003D6A575F
MPETPPQTSQTTLTCDWQDWVEHFPNIEASDAEKRALIELLWSMVSVFVDLGWEIAPKPQSATQETCGKQPDLAATLLHAVLLSTEEEDA